AWQNCPTLEDLRQLLSSKLDAISSEAIASLTAYNFILEALFGAASY
ncbi:transposase, partial [Stenomitos frigidus ULC18]